MSTQTRPERQILRVTDLTERLGISRTTLWRMRRAGEIPEPVRISANTIGWRTTDIDAWLADRPAV